MIKIDTHELTVFADKFEGFTTKFPNRQLMQQIGDFVAARTKTRTLQGLDINIRPFARYSKSYAKFRTKHGRRVDRVDLSYSGRMLAAIGTENVTDTSVLVGIFSGIEQKKGMIHQLGLYRGSKTRKRQFIGITETDVKTVQGVQKLMEAAKEKAIRENSGK